MLALSHFRPVSYWWSTVQPIINIDCYLKVEHVLISSSPCYPDLKHERKLDYNVTHRNLYQYYAIENTANQNTGKPLCIKRYYTQPSHRAPRVCPMDCVGLAFCIAWYKIVIQRSLVVYHRIFILSLFFWYTHSPKGSCVSRETTSVSWAIPWYTTRKRCITSIYLHQNNQDLFKDQGCNNASEYLTLRTRMNLCWHHKLHLPLRESAYNQNTLKRLYQTYLYRFSILFSVYPTF